MKKFNKVMFFTLLVFLQLNKTVFALSISTSHISHTTLGEIIFYVLDALIIIKLVSYVIFIVKNQDKKYLEKHKK